MLEGENDRIILHGGGGTGKTTATTSILKNPNFKGRLIYLMTEANSLPSVRKGLSLHKIDIEEGDVVYAYPKAKQTGIDDLLRAVKGFQQESAKKARAGNSEITQGKEHYGYFYDIFDNLSSFTGTCLATGKQIKLGNVNNFKKEDVLIIDGLTPISHEVWMMSTGDKIMIGLADYGAPQNIMNRIMQSIQRMPCHVILLAHSKPLMDGDTVKMEAVVNTGVGNSNYEAVMGCFTEVVYCYKLGTSYKLAGAKNKIYTITRKIPAEPALEQDLSKYGLFV